MPRLNRIDYFEVAPGSGQPHHGSVLPAGFVWASGKTVGNASSNATERANKDCRALFTVMWSSYTDIQLPIYTSAGVLTTRGASAFADWSANRAITIPDGRGRGIVGKDDMGGIAAGRMTISTIDGTILGNSGGEQTHQLVIAEMPSHNHAYANANSLGGSGPVSFNNLRAQQDVTATTGGDGAHNNVQPSLIANYILKL